MPRRYNEKQVQKFLSQKFEAVPLDEEIEENTSFFRLQIEAVFGKKILYAFDDDFVEDYRLDMDKHSGKKIPNLVLLENILVSNFDLESRDKCFISYSEGSYFQLTSDKNIHFVRKSLSGHDKYITVANAFLYSEDTLKLLEKIKK